MLSRERKGNNAHEYKSVNRIRVDGKEDTPLYYACVGRADEGGQKHDLEKEDSTHFHINRQM